MVGRGLPRRRRCHYDVFPVSDGVDRLGLMRVEGLDPAGLESLLEARVERPLQDRVGRPPPGRSVLPVEYLVPVPGERLHVAEEPSHVHAK